MTAESWGFGNAVAGTLVLLMDVGRASAAILKLDGDVQVQAAR